VESRVEADYVVIGAGAVGMSFVDVLVAESDASVVVVDRRARPGGHWNDAYSFVRLHQPSAYYGVNSHVLGRLRKDEHGTNAGLYELASGTEVCSYFDQVMQDALLRDGRVRYFPMSEYSDDERSMTSLLTGERTALHARRKVVDARYVASEVPSTHPPRYPAAAGIDLVPVNGLTTVRHPYAGYVVIGGGKTGIDACLWLLENSVDPSRITWIRTRDPWLLNRATVQGSGDLALPTLESFTRQLEVIARTASIDDLFAGLEEADILLRMDCEHRPTMFRGATVTHAEIEALRRIEDIVRLGYVERIDEDSVVLEHGTVPTGTDRLHVDCTAAGVPHRPAVPVFDDDRVTLQYLVWGGQPTLSAAITAYVETRVVDEAEKNALCRPLPMTGDADDIPAMLLADMESRSRWSKVSHLRDWLNRSRLNPMAAVARSIDPGDPATTALLERRHAARGPARENLERLLQSVPAGRR
jgi:hypothetical protein